MSLIAPWFLAGLLAIALPLWLHRLRTRNPQRVPFASAMLLEQSERRLQVQKRLRFLVLLSLRIAALALLALAFAQPLWRVASGAAAMLRARLHIIVIDASASMGAEGRMAAAQAIAAGIVRDLGSGDVARVVAAGPTLVPMEAGGRGPTSDRAALQRAIARVAAGTGRLEYAAVVGGIDGLSSDSELPVVVHLISDLQASGLTPRFADLLPRSSRARTVTLELDPLVAPAVPNWAIAAVRGEAGGIDVLVRGHGTPAAMTTVRLEVNGVARGEERGAVPAGGEAWVHFPAIALRSGENRVVATLASQDSLASDDRRYAVVSGGGAAPVPLLTPDPHGPAATYLAAAFGVAGGRYSVTAARIDAFDVSTLAHYPFVLVDDLGAAGDATLAALSRYLDAGGAVFAVLGARAAALREVPLGGEVIDGTTSRSADPLAVGHVDATHAALSGLEGWGAVSVARMARLRPAAADRVLVATEDGAPLLIEHPVGAGRLLVLASALDDVATDLPVQPVFVGFVAGIARYLSGDAGFTDRAVVGSVLQLPDTTGAGGQVIDPQGHELLSLAATRSARNVRLEQPGFYELVTAVRNALVAVNVDERESDLTPIDPATLANWRRALASAPTLAPAATEAQSGAGTVPLGPWLLALLGLVIVAESVAGNWLLQRNTKVLE